MHRCVQPAAFENWNGDSRSDLEKYRRPGGEVGDALGLRAERRIKTHLRVESGDRDADTRRCRMKARFSGTDVGPSARDIPGQTDRHLRRYRRHGARPS